MAIASASARLKLEANKGIRIGMKERIFFKRFPSPKSTPRALWAFIIRLVSSTRVGTNRKLIDNIKPISCAGTLMILNGVSIFSTASAKLNGVVVTVKTVE